MSFILAGIIVVITLAISLMLFFASMNSPTGLDGPGCAPVMIVGFLIAGLLVASHWMPSIGW